MDLVKFLSSDERAWFLVARYLVSSERTSTRAISKHILYSEKCNNCGKTSCRKSMEYHRTGKRQINFKSKMLFARMFGGILPIKGHGPIAPPIIPIDTKPEIVSGEVCQGMVEVRWTMRCAMARARRPLPNIQLAPKEAQS